MSNDHDIDDDRPDDSGMAEYTEWHEQQMALPPHQRDGYAEKILDHADDKRKEARLAACPF